MNNKNQVVIIGMALALVAGGVVGYTVAGLQYSAQLEKAKKFFPVMSEMRSVSGTVTKVSGNVVTISTPPSNNPFEDVPTTRDVVVTAATKVIKNVQKDQKVYQEEMTAYQAALQKAQKAAPAAGPAAGASPASAAVAFPVPPMPFDEKELKVSDIKTGDMISVEAAQNIKTQTRFEATRITVNQTPAGAVGPAGAAGPAGVPAAATGAAVSAPGSAPIVNTPPPARTNGGFPPR